MDALVLAKWACIVVALYARRDDSRAASVVLAFAAIYGIQTILMPAPADKYWFLLCAGMDFVTVLALLPFGKCQMTRLLSYLLGFCFVVNVFAFAEYFVGSRVIYDLYSSLIMLAMALEAAILLSASAKGEGSCRRISRV